MTWRIRKKRRGRKRLRATAWHAARYLRNRAPRPSRFTAATYSYRRAASRAALLRNLSWPEPPRTGPLILVADAFLQRVEDVWYTWYCVLARASDGEDAAILPPRCRRGTEVAIGWQEAFAALPAAVLRHSVALICDGHNGLILEARRRDWLIQRCHFHLLARLQSHRSRWRRGRYQTEGKKIHAAVHEVLTARSKHAVTLALRQLSVIGRTTTSWEIRRVISGLMTNYGEYRTYLRHPELRLPTTSNTAESFIGLIRAICQRAHGFRTLRSLHAWIEAFVKIQRTMKCRGNTNRIN